MGLFALWVVQPEKLSFRPTATPEGFRELVLQTPSSRPDMFLAGLPRSYEKTSADLSDGTSLSVCDALFHDPASSAVGSAESALIIVEFFDYQCPYCKTLSERLYQANKRTAAKKDMLQFLKEGIKLDRIYHRVLTTATPWQFIKMDLSIIWRTVPVVLRQ